VEPPRRDDGPRERPKLRVIGTRRAPAEAEPPPRRRRSPAAAAKARRRRRASSADVDDEIRRLAGRNADRALRRLMDAADAFAHGREREALRMLRPLRDQLPESPTVRELVGLCQYRLGNYRAASKELEAYANLSNSVDQNPVLMDCYRAQRRWQKVASAWEELAATSPSAELVAEGRIVYAGALADQGRLDEALAVLRKRAEPVRDAKEHHLRLWYALADLEERAGNIPRARELFDRVRHADPQYVDVAERRAALG
jgi:tetratricopeptide (TPR) repeat protein